MGPAVPGLRADEIGNEVYTAGNGERLNLGTTGMFGQVRNKKV